MEGGPVAAWFSVLTDVHLLLENGVLEEEGQQTGREVNVRVPCQEQELWVYIGGLQLVKPQCNNAAHWNGQKASPRAFC